MRVGESESAPVCLQGTPAPSRLRWSCRRRFAFTTEPRYLDSCCTVSQLLLDLWSIIHRILEQPQWNNSKHFDPTLYSKCAG